MSITPQQLVDREVYACVSYLVSALAGAAYTGEASAEGTDLQGLAEQAFELCTPIPDYEEAARYEGWTTADLTPGAFINPKQVDSETGQSAVFEPANPHDWQDLCEANNIEPYDREVYEHWIISDWLADQLEAHGEKVDRDFANLTIWARTTSGQAIASDYVVEQICAEMNAAA